MRKPPGTYPSLKVDTTAEWWWTPTGGVLLSASAGRVGLDLRRSPRRSRPRPAPALSRATKRTDQNGADQFAIEWPLRSVGRPSALATLAV